MTTELCLELDLTFSSGVLCHVVNMEDFFVAKHGCVTGTARDMAVNPSQLHCSSVGQGTFLGQAGLHYKAVFPFECFQFVLHVRCWCSCRASWCVGNPATCSAWCAKMSQGLDVKEALCVCGWILFTGDGKLVLCSGFWLHSSVILTWVQWLNRKVKRRVDTLSWVLISLQADVSCVHGSPLRNISSEGAASWDRMFFLHSVFKIIC